MLILLAKTIFCITHILSAMYLDILTIMPRYDALCGNSPTDFVLVSGHNL